MKRRLAILSGLAALGIAAFSSTGLRAQQPAPPQGQPPAQPSRPPQTRIAVINMVQVLKSYKKFLNMEMEMKNLQNQLQGRIEPFKAQMMKADAERKRPEITPEQREQIERQMKKIEMDASLVQDDAKKELMKRSGEAFTTIYRDVEDAVKRYAEMNGYELVMFYNGPVDHDKYNPANVQAKLVQPASLMPIYVTPGMDITPHIIESLNRMYPASAGAPGAAPAGAAAHAPPASNQR